MRVIRWTLLAATGLLAGCGGGSGEETARLARLKARAVLPADTFAQGPPVGAFLENKINGREPPFASVPVQGFSSLVLKPDGAYRALQDNGFGTMANSPDCPLRWYDLRLDLPDPDTGAGRVNLKGFTDLRDPEGLLPFEITQPDSDRILTGADLDPESFVLMDDGTYWVGDEFGPSLVHFSADGVVIDKPFSIPVAQPLRSYSRGSPFLRTPDHPDLRVLSSEERRQTLANLPRSGGIEGLARSMDGSSLYLSIEKPMFDDPVRNRRIILEFIPERHGFSDRYWQYLTEGDGISLASLEAVTDDLLLVVERDEREGLDAEIKRIYRVNLNAVDSDGFLVKGLVCDLLDIDDSGGITQKEKGTIGLGPRFMFPFITPECLMVVDDRTLLVVNDNNYPMSVGRRPPRTPDDSEFILLELATPLPETP